MSASISNAQTPTIATSSTATAANNSSAGSSANVAAGSAQPTARSSYANATQKNSSPTIASSAAPPVAVGGPPSAQHGKSSSVSPVNGNAIKPAIPSMPPIVGGAANGNGNVPGDHSRKSSVHIKQTPPTTGPPSGIKFGSLAGSPGPAHASPVVHGSLNVQAQNPRIASPAHSPSPIPPPISGGSRPDGLPTRPPITFGQGSEGPDASVSLRSSMVQALELPQLTLTQSRPMNIPHQPNNIPQPQHLRRESSQSSHSDINRGYQNQRAGSQRGYAQQHFNPNMPSHSPQLAYRPLPNQHHHMGRPGMAPAFQPQAGSPYLQNRSPALQPAAMHQPYYQQPHTQQVRISPPISTLSSVSETRTSVQSATAPRVSKRSSHSLSSGSASKTDLEFRLPSNEPNAFLQPFDTPFDFATLDSGQYLTTIPNQGMYGMPQQGMDAYGGFYQNGYGLQQSMYAGVPASPGRVHGFPQQMQTPYGAPSPYGQPPQAQSMSRTPSNMSERPSSAVPQPSTPAMTNVNHISHTHTPSIAASPAPSSSAFERPKKQSKAIVIKNGKCVFVTS